MALPLLVFALSGNIGLDLGDPGFLWYGAQRVLAGEVPLRDFQAYDIGRYYWSAAWMLLLGSDGIMALRTGQAVLGGVCVVMATLLVRKELRGPSWLLGAVAVSFWIWMVPSHKLADSFAVLLLVAGLSVLLRQRSPGGWALFGVCLGVATGIGINHGAYGAVAGALAILYCRLADRSAVTLPLLASFVFGGVLGYLPVLVFHVAVPGYSAAFFDAILQIVESGTTNIALPMPRLDAIWSSTAPFFMQRVREVVLALASLAAGAFLLWGTGRVLRGARQGSPANPPATSPVHAASLFVALPYCHYFLSRADLVHAAVSVLPILLAAWTHPTVRGVRVHRTALVLVIASSALLTLHEHPGYALLRGKQAFEWTDVRGDRLRLLPGQAAEVRFVRQTVQAHAAADHRMFYVGPYWPGAYPVVGRRSLAWENYPIFPARPQRQRAEIQRLAAADIGFARLVLPSRRNDCGVPVGPDGSGRPDPRAPRRDLGGLPRGLEELEVQGLLQRPFTPPECMGNAHMYFVLLPPGIDRAGFIASLAGDGIGAVSHYVPLHSSPAGRRYGRFVGLMANTDALSERLVRLPMWIGLEADQRRVITSVTSALS